VEVIGQMWFNVGIRSNFSYYLRGGLNGGFRSEVDKLRPFFT
jgi:hypothetical protein